MRNLFEKLKNNLQEKGWKKTMAVVFNFSKNKMLSNKKIKMALLKKYVNQHNKAYAKISQLAVSLNNGIHPKHSIMKYHQFFLDNILATDKILDAGSGTGLIAHKIAQKAKTVTGVDNNEQHIKEAREKYGRDNLKFILADLNNYQTEDKFDKIILSNVLEHIENRIELLKKLGTLAPIILVRVPLITRDWMTVYKKQMGLEYRLDDTHYIEYDIATLQNEVNAAGLKIESWQVNWGEWWGVLKQP
ncbi:hypothetical protein A3H03_01085 [Candidatus Kuenenbacteria bacterium RIFCSPLOWO2_12_FULL_42_13]|uniref:Methyltransferase domain-containing protein n=2 Tax=Candidatus Kueneniibacteriota TaxID=1752740 RepID=A0A1F6G1M4_9BACT|nr:MAG: hypothetical protein A3H03_01085 [Candidatus Kuenenbacteria bacterium RIFCSPLOWO2_12_FULL_42_13]OGG99008.1 MAG: hypothetical protein A3E04_01115 [Candidatus Kuenenbacteria bacterium RIFCSPHIGHO2_12_FULL_42_14]